MSLARLKPPQDTWKEAEVRQWLRDLAVRIRIAGQFTWNPSSVNGNTTSDQTLTSASYATLDGLRAGMPVFVTPPSDLNSGLILSHAWIPADNQLTIRLRNLTGAPIDQGSGTWGFVSVMV